MASSSRNSTSSSGEKGQCAACRQKDARIEKLLTDERKAAKAAQTTLTSLRRNVRELLRVIVPDLTLDNLEDVDPVVVEMVRVNSDTQNGDRSSAAAGGKKTVDGKGVKNSSGHHSSEDNEDASDSSFEARGVSEKAQDSVDELNAQPIEVKPEKNDGDSG